MDKVVKPLPESAGTASPPRLTIDGARATIRLNRPKHLNRLQPDALDALMELFERIEADAAVRVLVLTGTGRLQRRLRPRLDRRTRQRRA